MIRKTFDLPGIGPKTYEFPTVFEEVSSFALVAFVPYSAAAGWLPSPLRPAMLPGQRAMAMVTFQDLRRPAEMAPYREASFAVLSRTPGGTRAFHVLTMPVTSPENLARGRTIFGYPKELADVELVEGASSTRGSVRIDGELLFSAEIGNGVALPGRVPVTSRNLQVLDGQWGTVRTRIDTRLRLARGKIETSPLFDARWPGAPRRWTAHAGARLLDARWELHLPEPTT